MFLLPFTDLFRKHWQSSLKELSRLTYTLSTYAEPFWKEGPDQSFGHSYPLTFNPQKEKVPEPGLSKASSDQINIYTHVTK